MITRVQRSRKSGSKLPDNTLVVTRPTIWGNPWEGPDAVVAYRFFCEQVIAGTLDGATVDSGLDVTRIFQKPIDEWIALRSQMLTMRKRGVVHVACWCSIESRCHADIIRAIPFYVQFGRWV